MKISNRYCVQWSNLAAHRSAIHRNRHMSDRASWGSIPDLNCRRTYSLPDDAHALFYDAAYDVP